MMHYLDRRPFALLAISLLASAALSQGTGPVASFEAPMAPIHTQAADDGVGYGLWAAGRNYKASFHDGATFVPYLGRDYPQLQPLSWKTRSVRLGETELLTAATPRLSWTDYRAEYDLGEVIEAYDVLPEGLEQTFVINRRPTGRGDLVIRGAVETALRTEPREPAHGEIVFADKDGTPILSYGGATAIDANGNERLMTTGVEGNTVTLSLDSSWLETASYPVVVDPLIGAFYTLGNTPQLGEMDMIRDSSGSYNIWIGLERWASATDGDVWLRRITDDGLAMMTAYNDLTTAWSSADPSVGLHARAGRIVFAFSRHFVASDTRKLRFHVHARNDLSQTSALGTVNTGAAQAWRPDVATDLYALADRYLLVAFQQEGGATFYNSTTSSVYGVAIDLNGNNTAGTPFAVADFPFEDIERPSIGKTASNAQTWTVAYQVIGNNSLLTPHVDWDIEMVRADRHGNVSAPTTLGLANDQHELAPRVAGYDDVLTLGYTRSTRTVAGPRPTGANGMQLYTRRADWNGSSFSFRNAWRHSNQNDERLVLSGMDLDTDTESHTAITYYSTVTGRVYMRLVGYNAHLLVSENVFSSGTSSPEGAVTFDDDASRFLLAYGHQGPINPRFSIDAYVHPHQPTPWVAGVGCSTAQLDWQGSQLIGDEGCAIRLTGIAPGALATIIIGLAPTSQLIVGVPVVHPGCWLLVPNIGPGSLATMPIAFGPTLSYDMDLPEWLDPMTFYFQGVHFDASTTEVFTTQRLAVPLVK